DSFVRRVFASLSPLAYVRRRSAQGSIPLLDVGVRLLGVTHREQTAARFFTAQQPGYAGQGFQVLPCHTPRAHHAENDANRLSVDGVEGDALGAQEQRRRLVRNLVEGRVRNGNAIPNARALESLPLLEQLREPICIHRQIASQQL